MKRIFAFCKREAVLVIAAVAACVSMCFVPPDAAYLGYLDFHVLILLFCLMAVVAGISACGVLDALAARLCARAGSVRRLIYVLVLLPFFSSMLITNDVALITFVPLALLVLRAAGREELMIHTVVLQTIAANLGSMATPVGNPQNLFLYSRFSLAPGAFFSTVLPFALVSLLLLLGAVRLLPGGKARVALPARMPVQAGARLWVMLALFALCLLAVFRLCSDWLLLAAVLAALLICDRALFSKIDYALLATFVFFFLFAGNIARIAPLRALLAGWMQASPAVCTLLACQGVSNVPAAILLSGFTDDWRALLVYTNLGGLGTLIASLASLISFKLYLRTPHAAPLRYVLLFTGWNLAFLLILLCV